MTEIICISGAAPGKDMAAKMLKEELEKSKKRVLITYFSAPLRRVCREWFGWDGQNDDAGRSLLRYVGTDIVRARRPDFWVDFTLCLLAMMGDEWDYVIIPDCRHDNELDLDRYGFQARHIQVGDRRVSPNAPEPAFVLAGDVPRLHAGVVAAAQSLIYV